MFKRCPSCKSLWVCWNWIHYEDKDTLNWSGDVSKHHWIGECWNCAYTPETEHKVRTGIPYWILKKFGHYFTDNELFERNMAKGHEEFWNTFDGDIA